MKTALTFALAALMVVGIQTWSDFDQIDRGETQIAINGVQTHACPANHAMGGINFGGDGNTFMCRYVGTIIDDTFATVQRHGMLACAPGFFMTALNIERNYLQCSRNGNFVSTAAVTYGTDRSNVSQCGGSNSANAGVMVGFHKERKVMLCAGVRR
jgi:hypothetical protein